MPRACRPPGAGIAWAAFGFASAAMVASVAWGLVGMSGSHRGVTMALEDKREGAWEPREASEDVVRSRSGWSRPPADSRGEGWAHELFAPPELTLDAARGVLVAGGTPDPDPVNAPQGSEGIDLVSVRAQPFRLVLVGFVGAPGGQSALFRDLESGRSLSARLGTPVGETGFVLEAMDASGTQSRAGRVMLRDAASGEVTELVPGVVGRSGRLEATFRLAGDDSSELRLTEGESRRTGDALYRLAAVELDPPSVDLRISLDGGEEAALHLRRVEWLDER